MVNKVLDAVGLTGAVEAASAALGFGHQHETADELRDTSPIASHPGLVSAESGPPRHYRRESIPTTAYPGGLNSPRAVAPPIGGTQNQSSPTGYSSHVDRDINTGVDSVADDVRAPQETVRFRRRLQSITGGSDNTAPPIPSTFDMPTATSGAVHEYGSGQTFSTDDASEIVSQPTVQPRSTFYDQITAPQQYQPEQSYPARNLADNESTAAAVSASIHGLHDYNNQEATSNVSTPARDTVAHSQPSATPGTSLPPGSPASHKTYTISNAKQHVHEHPPHAWEVPYDTTEPALYHRVGAAAIGSSAEAQAERDKARHAWETENQKRLQREADDDAASKPSVLKRLGRKMLRRKNKDTGEDEDYSTDEDEVISRHSHDQTTHIPTHESAHKGHTVLGPSYEEASGGAHKPSYNPLHHDDALLTDVDPSGTGPTTAVQTHDSKPHEHITGVPLSGTTDGTAEYDPYRADQDTSSRRLRGSGI